MTPMRVKSHINPPLNPLIANTSVSYSARDKLTDLCMIDKLGQPLHCNAEKEDQ